MCVCVCLLMLLLQPCPDFAPGQGPTTSTRPVLPEKGVFEELDADELTAGEVYLACCSKTQGMG